MRTVAVTGVSGSLGQRVLAQLAAAAEVGGVVGLDRATPPEWPAKLRFHPLDLATADLAPRLEGVDWVAHLAWSEAGPNLEATRRLLDAASTAGVGHLVHLSCATVYGAWPDNPVPIAEDGALRPNPQFREGVEKAEAERMVAEWAVQHPAVKVTILRPAVVLGEGSPGPLARALFPVLTIRGRGEGPPIQFVDADDVAAAVVGSLVRGAEGVFNVAPDGWIGDELLRSLVGPPARLPLSRRVAERAAAAVHWLRGGKAPRHAAAFGRHPLVVANDRLRATGWSPRHTNEEALVASPLAGRWPELSPKRRQEVALGLAAGVAASLVAGALGLARRARRRRAS
ncbi:MAG TPA: NAD-dependent epimerase/dehydratase family protein [Acidimicrobiales bacterium]